MSLKFELETWAAALQEYDEGNYIQSLELFERIADSSKIYTNLGLVHAAIGEHELAVEQFRKATGADQYLAIAYFQCGVSNFLLERYELALSDFEQTYLYMRGNTTIYYEQLGLRFNLYSAEVLFNKGLSMIYLGQLEEGLAGMREAERQQMTDAHKVITDAVRDQGDGYTVFSMPMGVLYRPPEKKVKNTAPKNYIGKATLVAAQETQDLFTGFTGIELRNRAQATLTTPSVPAKTSVPVDGPKRPKVQTKDLTRPNAAGKLLTPPVTPPKPLVTGVAFSPVTAIYDDYLGSEPSGNRQPIPPVPPLPTDIERVGAWAKDIDATAKKTMSPPTPPDSYPPTTYEPSSFGGISRTTRRIARGAPSYRAFGASVYDDANLICIRVKIHYQGDLRGMSVAADIQYAEFVERVTRKFGKSRDELQIQFVDEDGTLVSLRDDSDFELALGAARENAQGRPDGRLEVWCRDGEAL